jgi:hypothetical protein
VGRGAERSEAERGFLSRRGENPLVQRFDIDFHAQLGPFGSIISPSLIRKSTFAFETVTGSPSRFYDRFLP